MNIGLQFSERLYGGIFTVSNNIIGDKLRMHILTNSVSSIHT